jgi:RNA polymerase sigma-70 factor (ECF subfamily)
VVSDESVAEEVAQEAVIRAWRFRASCETPARPAGWLRQITRREAIRFAEREAAARERSDAVAAECASLSGEDASPLTRIVVEEALGQLDPEDRLLIRLRYEADLTQPRIAELLGMPEGTAKVRLHRLRAELRKAMGGEP